MSHPYAYTSSSTFIRTFNFIVKELTYDGKGELFLCVIVCLQQAQTHGQIDKTR